MAKNLEIIALKSQLALLTEQLENKKIKKPQSNKAFRELWVLISKFHPDWKPPSEKQQQSWKTLLKNHSKDIWAMDYFTVPTIRFKILYVFIIISNLHWVKQQLRNATPYGYKPKYLIHDNDPVFVSKAFQLFLSNMGIKSKRTSYYSPWQNGISERANGIIRQELTNHIILLAKDSLLAC